jgi:hypothetical protein
MKPSTPPQPQGSFGIPAEMKKQIEQARTNAADPSARPNIPPPPESIAPAPAESKEENKKDSQEQDPAESLAKYKASLEENLEIKLTADDIKTYLFKGRLSKEVLIVPGFLKGTFQTLTATDSLQIDQRMADLRDAGKLTAEGLANEGSIITLSYAWLAADGKPLTGKNGPEAALNRESKIRAMGGHMLDAAARAWTDYNALIRVCMSEKRFVKKS